MELVGHCRKCGIEIFCKDGFLDGVISAENELFCFKCAEDRLTITCEDVILREYRLEDLDALQELTWQPEIYEFLPGWNVPKEQRLDWLAHYEINENKQFLSAVAAGGRIGELRLRLGIILKETGELIGWCCTGIKEELPSPGREIMFAISKHHRGKGYTTQAAKGMINYLFENTDVNELHAIALLTNQPSNRVIQKCGFVFSSIIEIDGDAYNRYLYSQSKWLD
ncbi:GNAT family N-acetyltransferase [Paenibacillus sp. LHD-38]|uniref:GNAT family N-acetyltransferase n=1 Tax=Paenibacillus sp. LHD-38 TaxID=3072143 RepID=UPI00280C6702|nr:GNAT family N-acetyltransferase [Paenibacillus sp. LHD-38]MDQ8736261.1 GNAT family N-acetyltransferase [Paenibacillus sp. LHD-38]